MTSNSSFQPSTHKPKTIFRAKKALSCSSFCLQLFKDMRNQSVLVQQIAGTAGVESGYVTQACSETRVEHKLVWLMNVGLLRREVDGQGLTNSFRLTPLGRAIISEWEQGPNQIPTASTDDYISNWLNRWL